MLINHEEYLNYEIPDGWKIYEEEEITSIYDENSEGLTVLSFYNIKKLENSLVEHVSTMINKFIKNNKIKIDSSINEEISKEGKLVLSVEGKLRKKLFVKVWAIAKYPRVIIISYENREKIKELETIDTIVKSLKFNF